MFNLWVEMYKYWKRDVGKEEWGKDRDKTRKN